MSLETMVRPTSGDYNAGVLLLASRPVAWLLFSLPVFLVIIHQPPGSVLRWGLLPLGVLGPVLSFWNADKLSLIIPGLGWIWAYTCIIGLTHGTAGVYIESWYLPQWDLLAAYKLWNNPRRLPTRKSQSQTHGQESPQPAVTQYQRLTFVLGRVTIILLLGVLYNIIKFAIKLVIFPMPKDFGAQRQTYFYFALDRQARIRAIFCIQWAWVTWMVLTVANACASILFVGILQLDTPDEWPRLYGNPIHAYSLQRYWSQFSHNIGAPSQAAWGRIIARHTFPPGSRAEKIFVACFVFLVAGLTHSLVSWRTDPDVDPMGDEKFLMLNFAGGAFEFLLGRLTGQKGRGGHVGLARRILGYLWVYAFFYVTVPPWQWPIIKADVAKTVPDVRFNVQLERRPVG